MSHEVTSDFEGLIVFNDRFKHGIAVKALDCIAAGKTLSDPSSSRAVFFLTALGCDILSFMEGAYPTRPSRAGFSRCLAPVFT